MLCAIGNPGLECVGKNAAVVALFKRLSRAGCTDLVGHPRAAGTNRFASTLGTIPSGLMLGFGVYLGPGQDDIVESHIHTSKPMIAPSEP